MSNDYVTVSLTKYETLLESHRILKEIRQANNENWRKDHPICDKCFGYLDNTFEGHYECPRCNYKKEDKNNE